MVQWIIQILVLLFMPFLFIGVINRTKSLWAGRKGPRLLQAFYDFFKLMKKGEVISTSTSFLFKMSPALLLASVLTAGLIIPMIHSQSLFSFEGDFILFAYILAIGKFFSILSALDTASSFEGMGAAREVTFSSFVEPGFFLLFSALCFMSGVTRFESLFTFLPERDSVTLLVQILGSLVVLFMVLAEGCRVPVDDPNTHLELTMIHEVMILDNSGPDLGFIQYASACKMVILSSIIPNLIIPPSTPLWIWLSLYFLTLLAIAVVIGMIESLIARLRMIHVPQFLFSMTAVSMIVLAALLIYHHGGTR